MIEHHSWLPDTIHDRNGVAGNGLDDEFAVEEFDFEKVFRNLDGEVLQSTQNLYREAARKFLREYDRALAFIIGYENPRLAAWVVALASGRTLITGGLGQADIAARLGLTRAAVSKCVKHVQASFGNSIIGIEPMPGQRTRESGKSFRDARKKQLHGSSTKNGNG